MGYDQKVEMSAELSLTVHALKESTNQTLEAKIDLPFGTFCTVEKIKEAIDKTLEQLKNQCGDDIRLLTNSELVNLKFYKKTGFKGDFYAAEDYAEPFKGMFNINDEVK